MFKIELTPEDLVLIMEICHNYKDEHRGSADFIRPIMNHEKKITEQTHGEYISDTTYDI